jgi:hypothetical protein
LTYYQMDDGFLNHHKTKRALRAGAEALQMWLALRSYVALNESDGVIPDEDIDDLDNAPAEPRKWLEVLVNCGKPLAGDKRGAGLVDKHATGWVLHNYKKYGLTKKQIQERREAAKERQRRWREGHIDPELESDTEDQCVSNGVTDGEVDLESNAVSNGVRDASPSHPISGSPPSSFSASSDQPNKSRSPGGRAKGGGRRKGQGVLVPIPEPFPLLQRHLEYGQSKNWPNWWVQSRHERFCDLAKAKAWRYADWHLAFYTFLRGEIEYSRGPAQLQHLAPRGPATTPPVTNKAAQQAQLSLEARAREQNNRKPRPLGGKEPANANHGTRATDAPSASAPPAEEAS